jgi:hypothetical protein
MDDLERLLSDKMRNLYTDDDRVNAWAIALLAVKIENSAKIIADAIKSLRFTI